MLSFMKEQQGAENPGQEEGGQVPDGVQDQAFYTVSGRENKVRNSTVFFMTLFAIGALGLWFMIHKSKARSAGGTELSEEVQIEVAITRLTGVSTQMVDRMDKIVKKFYEFSNVPQVEVNELRKNPFHMETYAAVAEAAPSLAGEEQTIAYAKKVLWQQMLVEWNELVLVSVMHSPRGSRCVIDDSLLKEGDWAGHFKVTKIQENSVALVWQPPSVDLSIMSEQSRHRTLVLSQ